MWLKSDSHESIQSRHLSEASSNTQLSLKAACLILASEVALVKSHEGMTQWRVSLEPSADLLQNSAVDKMFSSGSTWGFSFCKVCFTKPSEQENALYLIFN